MPRLSPQQERLLFLARVVWREIKHLQNTDTDNRLFAQPLTLTRIAQLDSDEDLGERVEAFISRFGRLQDTLGDKLLPHLLAFVGERTATAVDNLDRAERLGWIKSSDSWLETRKLRNKMVHEYIEAPEVLVDTINSGHQRVADLVYAASRMLTEIDRRIVQK